MTATPKTKQNRGLPQWAVPTVHLRDFIEDHKTELAADASPISRAIKGSDVAFSAETKTDWQTLLIDRIAKTLNLSRDGAARRLWETMHGHQRVINAEFADAVCIAVGKRLDDNDADLPTLPFTRGACKEMIQCRAEYNKVELDRATTKELADRTWRITRLILKYPHHTEMLRDMAPFDCLRAYR